MLKVHFETLGCKLNQTESEGIASSFKKEGFEVSFLPVTADSAEKKDTVLCVLNTCAVTAKAEQKGRRIIRLLLSKYPNAVIVVTGCYAQLNKEDILALDKTKRLCVLGGQYKSRLSEISGGIKKIIESKTDIKQAENEFAAEISEFLEQKFAQIQKNAVPGVIQEPFKLLPEEFMNHSRPSIKIQDGCNNSCTYCKIRLARGKSVSLDAEEVIHRIKSLEKNGSSEVVITTVNIAQYRGKYGETTVNFAGLLKLILQNTEKINIRISSLYPEIVNEEFAQIIGDKRVMPHFHISVQSGSDFILSKMKRPYKAEKVYEACRLLKKYKDSPFLACDIITGFPGETDEDFSLTKKMLEECGFTYVHAFPFSPREGTEAYKMRPMVPNSISKKRVAELEKYSEEHKKAYIASFAGKTLTAICENVRNPRVLKNRTIVHAVTENFLHCQLIFDGTTGKHIPKAGEKVTVKIIRPLKKEEITGECDTKAEII